MATRKQGRAAKRTRAYGDGRAAVEQFLGSWDVEACGALFGPG